MEPGEVGLEELDLPPEHPVGDGEVVLEVGLLHARVGGEHDLVRHLAEGLDNRPDARTGSVGEAADRKRHAQLRRYATLSKRMPSSRVSGRPRTSAGTAVGEIE